MDENRQKEVISVLNSIYRALNELEVKGKQNHAIVVACMNDIEKIIKSLDGKEANDGNTNT
jgi:hypothetical protein